MGKMTQFLHTDTWRPWALGSLLAVASAISVFSLDAWARDEAFTPDASGMHAAHGGHHGRGMPPGGMGLFPMGGPRLDRLLDEVKATDAQRTQIKVLAKAAEADLKPMHEQQRALHEQTLALFTQPQVDAAAAEKLRQQALAGHDALSKRMLQLALDASKVLTPEQRIALATKVQKRHDGMKSQREDRPRLEQ